MYSIIYSLDTTLTSNDKMDSEKKVRRRSITFGKKLKSLRREKGIGIKTLAPELKINYTYLSKLENDKILPSTELIKRISKYFNYDYDELLISANKIPEDVLKILQDDPKRIVDFLRKEFGASGNESKS